MSKSLEIKVSSLPLAGLGLFAKRAFKKGEQIIEYKGRLQRWRDVKHEDGYNGYLLRLNRTHAIDGLRSKSFGRYANDAQGLRRLRGLSNNAEYVVYGLRCFLEARRDIQKGEEILVYYGKEYWDLIRKIKQRNGAGQTTPPTRRSRKPSTP
ncbi:MAG: SET domain-containing protein [Bacteroidota bacterium]